MGNVQASAPAAPPPPPTPTTPIPPPTVPEKKEDDNPGPMEDLHKKCKGKSYLQMQVSSGRRLIHLVTSPPRFYSPSYCVLICGGSVYTWSQAMPVIEPRPWSAQNLSIFFFRIQSQVIALTTVDGRLPVVDSPAAEGIFSEILILVRPYRFSSRDMLLCTFCAVLPCQMSMLQCGKLRFCHF